mgnify:CR=1 FL=1
MEKIRFEYEIELSEEVQDRYNEMAQDSALPIIINSMLYALKETELDMERIINGFHSVWEHKGKDGLRRIVPIVNKFNELKIIDIDNQSNEALNKIKKQLKDF